MSKAIFITGTGTDIGKTYISALIMKKLTEAGKKAAYYKAAVSGNERDSSGKLFPGDAAYVKAVSRCGQDLDSMCPYIYENAVSPHLAARIEGNPVEPEAVKSGFDALAEKFELITMEGSGGIVCPIRRDERTVMLTDIIAALGLSCILAADAGLGTINSVVLTCEYMKAHGIPVKGIIFNRFRTGTDSIVKLMQEDNIKMCTELTGIPCICTVKESAFELDISADKLVSLYEEVKR